MDAALLAHFSVFDTATPTLTIQMGHRDVDDQLDSIEADLGIDQGWEANLEDRDNNRVDVVGHRDFPMPKRPNLLRRQGRRQQRQPVLVPYASMFTRPGCLPRCVSFLAVCRISPE